MRSRIAPTPTGLLHAGHAATFWRAFLRCRDRGGTLVLRIEDLDPQRCSAEFSRAAIDDLRWLGIVWQEGPDRGGPFGPYTQSQRTDRYLEAWRILKDADVIYPCTRSRRDVAEAAVAPHDDAEPVFPAAWRPAPGAGAGFDRPDGVNWRFRVPDGRRVGFCDGRVGAFQRVAGEQFGDFVVWRRDGVPAYELAVVVDDIAMEISEVVRGEDLLVSTCRQLLIYEALATGPPEFFHTELIYDESGHRLAKRSQSLSLRTLRESGRRPGEILPVE